MNKSPLIGMTGCKGGTTDREEMRAILLWPLPIEFYEVKYRLQPLGNKREDTFSGREGPEAAPPSSMSSSTKHCSVQEEPQLFIDPQEASFWDFFFFFLFFPTQCSSTTRPAADSQALARSALEDAGRHPRERMKPVEHQCFSPKKPTSKKAPRCIQDTKLFL